MNVFVNASQLCRSLTASTAASGVVPKRPLVGQIQRYDCCDVFLSALKGAPVTISARRVSAIVWAIRLVD